jgi:hypothetical protein
VCLIREEKSGENGEKEMLSTDLLKALKRLRLHRFPSSGVLDEQRSRQSRESRWDMTLSNGWIIYFVCVFNFDAFASVLGWVGLVRLFNFFVRAGWELLWVWQGL